MGDCLDLRHGGFKSGTVEESGNVTAEVLRAAWMRCSLFQLKQIGRYYVLQIKREAYSEKSSLEERNF